MWDLSFTPDSKLCVHWDTSKANLIHFVELTVRFTNIIMIIHNKPSLSLLLLTTF